MAILHGSWLLQSPQQTQLAATTAEAAVAGQGSLFIWGEVWRRVTSDSLPNQALEDEANLPDHPPLHPYAMSRLELVEFLNELQQAGHLRLPSLQTWANTVNPAAARRSCKGSRPTSVAPTPSSFTSPTAIGWHQHTLAVPSFVAEGEFESGDRLVILPQLSAAPETQESLFLHPWLVEGLHLPVGEAIQFLNSLPLGAVKTEESFLGGDLRFWSHVARWSLDLLARSKFLPGLGVRDRGSRIGDREVMVDSDRFWVGWEPLLDSAVDQMRLLHFSDRMPVACRMYEGNSSLAGDEEHRTQDTGQRKIQDPKSTIQNFPLAVNLPVVPQTLLQAFLQSTLDAQIRQVARTTSVLEGLEANFREGGRWTIAPAVHAWLRALSQETSELAGTDLESLQLALQNWTAPLQSRRSESLFQTCLYLHPPQHGQTQWRLEYFLQAIDDPEFLIDAPTIWNNPVEQFIYRGRTITQPQETFLMGLGLASRLYPLIEPSLQESRPQFCTLTPLQAYDFLKSTAWRLQDSGLGVVVPPSLASQGGWANRLGLKIQAQTGKLKQGQRLGLQSLLNFRWELTIGGQSISKEEFDRLVALNTPLVEINGEWVELRPQDIRAAQNFFASRKDQPALSLEDALRISTGDTQMIEKLPVVSFEASGALEELINTLSGKRTLEAIATPASFRGELRPYQSRGVGWLAFLEQWSLGACLADDMGLGKTIQLIAFLLHLKEQGKLEKPTLLICPTSVLGNWEREVKKFGPSLKVLQHHGDGRPKGKDFAKAVKGKDLVISSYALVYRDLQDLQTVSWQGIVLDEAQNIKNPDAKQSQAIRQLTAQFRIALTGTPVENRLSELWSILDFLNPGYLGPKNFFQRRFATPIERYGDTASLQTLRSLVQPFILRRLKTDREIIQALPEKQEMTVFCGLSEEQASLYQHVVDQSLVDIEAAEGIQRKGIILALLTKLKQICNHPDLFLKGSGDGDQAIGIGDQGLGITSDSQSPNAHSFQSRSGKLKRLEEMLEEVMAEGDRALIFTQFAEWGKLLKAHLEQQLERETLFLYGSTPKKQREAMVDRFQHDPQGPRLFILSLKAGGVGLNLTRANHVFHFDRWWNPAVENQATDRVFRIGQTRNVQVHKFVCSGTLEEKIHDLIESKKALAEQVVGTGENWLTELNTDQLRDLLLLDRSAIIGEE
ncbi:DEAD/DEAH box helicase [Leptodesmis sp.]|uniref:DEAD/DEAH box helicase n=1 Tax=Leptodesmis sp. TaxID=3100501 RepID=UPI0040535602